MNHQQLTSLHSSKPHMWSSQRFASESSFVVDCIARFMMYWINNVCVLAGGVPAAGPSSCDYCCPTSARASIWPHYSGSHHHLLLLLAVWTCGTRAWTARNHSTSYCCMSQATLSFPPSQARNQFKWGEYTAAEATNKLSKKWSIIGIVCAVIFAVIVFVVVVLANVIPRVVLSVV